MAIWQGTPPDAAAVVPARPETVEVSKEDLIAGKPVIGVHNVSRPTMTVYSPKGKNTGVAAVVFPGGGYVELAIELEGTEACDRLTSRGITCVLLKYRVPDSGPAWHNECNCNIHPKAPPTFLLRAEDDNVDGVKQSLVYYMALKTAGVPLEMHLYAQGGHAFALRRTKLPITEWPGLVGKWLGTMGMISE